jgi:hypothetical protein
MADDETDYYRLKREEHRRLWKEQRRLLRRKFYFLQVTDHGNKKPYVTICLLWDPATGIGSRGVAVCHPKDTPNKKAGRIKANGWAERAMFHQRVQYGTSTLGEVLWRFSMAMQCSGNSELTIAHLTTDPKLSSIGQWMLLSRYYVKALDPSAHEDERFTLKELELINKPRRKHAEDRSPG